MVRFEKDKLVIEIVTKFPEDDLRELQRDLLRLMSAADKDMIDNDNDCVAGVCSLLEEMLPDEKQVRRPLMPGGNGVQASAD